MALEKCIVGRVNWQTQVTWVLDAGWFGLQTRETSNGIREKII